MNVPVIHTERVTLREPRLEDLGEMAAYFRDPRSAWNGGPLERHDAGRAIFTNAGQWQLRGHGIWHVTLAGSDTFIGFCGIFHPVDWPEPELGYGITAKHEGKGLAFQAVEAARKAAATHLGLTELPSFIAPENERSQRLAIRLGAVREDDIMLRGKLARVYRHPALQEDAA